jgi:hypothetical protein
VKRAQRRSDGWFLLLSLLASVVALADALPKKSAQTVPGVLEALSATGVQVIYSSGLVPDDMVAPPMRGSRTALQYAGDVLAAYGLELRPFGPKRYLVTRGKAGSPALPAAVSEPFGDPEPLSEVSVYGSRYAIRGRELGEPRLLTPSDIRVVPGSEDDPVRALRSLPGMATNASARPYIRGALTEDVLIRYDGVPLLDPFHLKNFQSLISAIDPAAVAKMDVYSGGFPVRFGTRSAGVIDIVPPTRESGYDNAVNLSLLTVGASSVGRSERWPVEWLVAARRSTVDLVLEPLDTGIGKPRFADTLGRLKLNVSEHSAWTAGWLLLDDRIALGSPGDEEIADAHYRDMYLWLTQEQILSDRLTVRTTFTHTSAERSRFGTLQSLGVAKGAVGEERSIASHELLIDGLYAPSDYTVFSGGASIARSRSEYVYRRDVEFAPAVAFAFSRGASDHFGASAAPRSLTYSAYAAARNRWAQWEAELGVRLDGQVFDPGSSTRQWSPRLNVRYDVSERWRAYASVGRFTQAQRVDEWRAEEGQQAADPAQVSVHTIFGLTYTGTEGLRWSFEAYDKRWTRTGPYFDSLLDPFALLPDLSPDRLRLAPGSSEARGFELSLQTPVFESTKGSATLSWSRVADDLGGTEAVRSWDQPLALTAGLIWSRPRVDISVFTGWHQGWPRTPVGPASTGATGSFVIDARNSARWPAFFTVDLRAAWRRPTVAGEWSTFIDITNVTNRSNPCCTSLGASLNGGTVPQSEVSHWLPLVINLGVVFHWRSDR